MRIAAGDTILTNTSAVSSAGRKRLRRELPVFRAVMARNGGGFVAPSLVVATASDRHRRVGANRQRLVQDAVGPDSIHAETVACQPEANERLADRPCPERCVGAEDHVPVGGVRPGGAAVVEPGTQCSFCELAESLIVSSEVDPSVGQVDIATSMRTWLLWPSNSSPWSRFGEFRTAGTRCTSSR